MTWKENEMATVRFSKDLHEEIVKNARGVFGKQLEAATDAKPDQAWGDKIYNILFGEHTAVLNAVPDMFLKKVSTIEIEKVGSQNANLKFALTSDRPWPTKFPDTEYAKQEYSYRDGVVLKDHLVWGEFHAEVVKWKQGIREVEEKREAFVKQVKTIIEAHATLAPALKMWPPLWDLVPEEYKERHREVKEREKKEVTVNVDLGSMTAAVVANKITR
jgi:hypothetical protein